MTAAKTLTQTLPATAVGIATAAAILRAGGLVSFATETVYGLGADATSPEAVSKIFTAKGRPQHNPLIVHVSSVAMAETFAILTPLALTAIKCFWPGPLTLVLKARPESGLGAGVLAGLDTVALRFPTTEVATDLIRALGKPIAAPSANLSGQITATTAHGVLRQLGGRIDAVIQSGPTAIGLESTIIDMTGTPTLLRHGAIPFEALALVFPELRERSLGAKVNAPGQMESHYAPKGPVRMNVVAPEPTDLWIGFGNCPGSVLSLSLAGDLSEAAHRLYSLLAEADLRLGPGQTIAFAPIPNHGLGRAINDRITRAMAPRGH